MNGVERRKRGSARKRTLIALCTLLLAVGAPVAFFWIGSAAGLFDTGMAVYDEGKTGVFFLDVGQGDATLVRAGNGTVMLIDAGPGAKSSSLCAALTRYGVKKLDILLLTHADEDHVGGAPEVISAFPVEKILYGRDDDTSVFWRRTKQAARKRGLPLESVSSGDELVLSPECVLDVLAPLGAVGEECDNDRSVVLRMTCGGTSFLFTGDAGEAEEDALIVRYGRKLRSDLLKAGHHGSDSSSSLEFLERVEPRFAVVSCGENNDFGHPHAETIDRLKRAGATVIWRTDREGDVIIQTDGETLYRSEPPGMTPIDRIALKIGGLFA